MHKNKLAPRKARDLRPAEMKIKRGPSVPDVNKEQRWPHDLPRLLGGKAARYPSIRAPIKGYRKMERRLNPPPKLRTVGLHIAGCLRFVSK